MTTGAQSLLDWFLTLFDPNNPQARAAFEQDPQRYLEECGFGDVTPQDIADVYPLILENTQANTNQALDNSSNVTGGTVNFTGAAQAAPAALTLPPPQPGDTELETVIKQIQHVTNNVTIDQTTTNVDNSLNQNIDNRGGTFDQTIDNDPVTAIGDGAQAAGDNLTTVEGEGNIVAGDDLDINDSNVVTGTVEDSLLADDITNSNVAFGEGSAAGQGNVTGDQNVVGDNNQAVTGNESQGAFGEGAQAVGGEGNQVAGDDLINANLENVDVDDGGALAIGGDATGENTEIDVEDSENVNVIGGDVDVDDSEDVDVQRIQIEEPDDNSGVAPVL